MLRPGRVRLRLEAYRSLSFGSAPFAQGERREACLNFGQLRSYSIVATSARNSTLYVHVDTPISAIYARRGAAPDVAGGLYDGVASLRETPRWGCVDAACTDRSHYSLSLSGCAPDAAAEWHVILELAIPELATAAAAAAKPSAVVVGPSRFFVTMVLLPAESDALATAFAATATTLRLDARAGRAAALAASEPARYLCCGAFRHYRLASVPAAPRAVGGAHRRARLAPRHLPAARRVRVVGNAAVATGGGGDSAGCGVDGCLVDWMAKFNPYSDEKLYRLAGPSPRRRPRRRRSSPRATPPSTGG